MGHVRPFGSGAVAVDVDAKRILIPVISGRDDHSLVADGTFAPCI